MTSFITGFLHSFLLISYTVFHKIFEYIFQYTFNKTTQSNNFKCHVVKNFSFNPTTNLYNSDKAKYSIF